MNKGKKHIKINYKKDILPLLSNELKSAYMYDYEWFSSLETNVLDEFYEKDFLINYNSREKGYLYIGFRLGSLDFRTQYRI